MKSRGAGALLNVSRRRLPVMPRQSLPAEHGTVVGLFHRVTDGTVSHVFVVCCSVVFKGEGAQEAVLCTSSSTFSVKDVKTSNLVMLVQSCPTLGDAPGSQGECGGGEQQDGSDALQKEPGTSAGSAPVVVSALVNEHLELREIQPRLGALDDLLANKCCIEDEEKARDAPGKTWQELVCAVQASEAELRTCLEELEAVRIQGLWKGVSPGVVYTVIKLALLTMTEHGWSIELVPGKELASALEVHGIAPEFLVQLIHRISCSEGELAQPRVVDCIEGLDREDITTGSDDFKYRIDSTKLCRQVGIGILGETPFWDDLNAFMSEWSLALPEDINPDITMLSGEALVMQRLSTLKTVSPAEDSHSGYQVKHVPSRCLPRQAEERFARLFSIQRSWTFQQIQPYIAELAGPGQTEEEVLLKYARQCQMHPEDEVTYTLR